MSVFDFFSRGSTQRKGELSGTSRPSDTSVELDDSTPVDSTELAQRHHDERVRQLLWDEGDDAPAESEDWTDLFERQNLETAAAVAPLSAQDAKDFRRLYDDKLKNLTDKAATALKQAFRNDHPEEYARAEAQRCINYIKSGKPIPALAQEAYTRGRTDGYAQMVDEGDDDTEPDAHERGFDNWVHTIPAEDQALCRLLYLEGENAGMRQAADEEFGPVEVGDDVDEEVPGSSFVPSCLKAASLWDSPVKPVQFLAGDFGIGKGHLMSSGCVRIPHRQQVFELKDVEKLEVATEESVTRIGGAVGWGVVGASLLGPAGLIVGGILGAKGKDVTFVGVLRDGKRFLASARSSVYEKFLAAAFR